MNILIRLRNLKNSLQTKIRIAVWCLEYPGRVEFGDCVSSRDVMRLRLAPKVRWLLVTAPFLITVVLSTV